MGDHVFVAGADGFQNNIRHFLELRGAKSPADPTVTNIQRYVAYLNTTIAAAERPVGQIYIGSHASPDGWMDIDLDDEAPGQTPNAHTDIDELIAATASGSVKLNAATLSPTTEIRIRGCEVGRKPKFMTALKDAFGGTAVVVAPKFFDVVGDAYLVKDDGTRELMGALEFFAYPFLIRRTTRYKDRAEALKDFEAKTATFTFIDGTPVPKAAWENWLPTRTDPVWTYDGDDQVVATRTKNERLSTPIGVLSSWNCTPGIIYYRFEAKVRLAKATPALPTVASMKTFAKANLPKIRSYKDDYPIPVYEDFGFASVDAMVDGIGWRVDTDDAGDRTLVGFQYQYTVTAPVLDRATGWLLFNFETADAAQFPVHTGIPETDATIFARV